MQLLIGDRRYQIVGMDSIPPEPWQDCDGLAWIDGTGGVHLLHPATSPPETAAAKTTEATGPE